MRRSREQTANTRETIVAAMRANWDVNRGTEAGQAVDERDRRFGLGPGAQGQTIELALENNRDIEVARKSSTIAEWDLRGTGGIFQPRLSGQSYYERATTPNVSIFMNRC